MKKILGLMLIGLMGAFGYLLFMPVPIDPAAWESPPDRGYVGAHAPNARLAAITHLDIGGSHGPEDVALDRQGRIYVSTFEGEIVRLETDGNHPQVWALTGGRPLGIDFDPQGELWVADAFRGLLSIGPDGAVVERATVAGGIPIRYADDIDVAPDGRVYFTDASTRFGARAYGGTYEASLLDLMEHRPHGRLLAYDPVSNQVQTIIDGLSFANGVAVSPDGSFLLVNETGEYRVLRHWLKGARKGQTEPFVSNLPGFPDNISAGIDGRFWIALVSPRNSLLDQLSDKPALRKIVQRLPSWIRPRAVHYGHVVAVDGTGKVVADLQDPEGGYPLNTSAVETAEFLYLGSLVSPSLGRLEKPAQGW